MHLRVYIYHWCIMHKGQLVLDWDSQLQMGADYIVDCSVLKLLLILKNILIRVHAQQHAPALWSSCWACTILPANPLHFFAGKKKTLDGTPISVVEVLMATTSATTILLWLVIMSCPASLHAAQEMTDKYPPATMAILAGNEVHLSPPGQFRMVLSGRSNGSGGK